MKKLFLAALALALCLSFSACGSTVGYENDLKASADYAYGSEVSVETTTVYGMSYPNDDYETPAMGKDGTDGALPVSEEKLVYTSRVTLETEDFDNASNSLHAVISKMGGIIVSENAYNLNGVNRRGYRTLDMTVRIPQENYEAFLTGLSEAYNVASVNNSVENFTERYYDNENRLASYRVQEARLLEMLGQAKTVKEMLEIESRLSDVQYRIESLTNSQRTIDNNVKYATFYLSLEEVTKYTTPEPKTFGERFTEALRSSGENFGDTMEFLLFVLIYLLPHLAVIAVIVVIIVLCCKHAKKKRLAKIARAQAAQNGEPQK